MSETVNPSKAHDTRETLLQQESKTEVSLDGSKVESTATKCESGALQPHSQASPSAVGAKAEALATDQEVAGSNTQTLILPCPTKKCQVFLRIEAGDNPLRLVYEHFQSHRDSSMEREQLEQEYADLASAHREFQMEFNTVKSTGPRSGLEKQSHAPDDSLNKKDKAPTKADGAPPSGNRGESSRGERHLSEGPILSQSKSPEEVPETERPQYCDMCLKSIQTANSSATELLSIKEPEVPETTSIDQTLGIEKLHYCNICLKSIDKMNAKAKEKHFAGCGTTVDASISLTAQEAKQERQSRKSRGPDEESRGTVATRSSPGASKRGQKRKREGGRESTPIKRTNKDSE